MAPYPDETAPPTGGRGSAQKATQAKPRKSRETAKVVNERAYGPVKLADLLIPYIDSRYRYCPELGWLQYTGAKWLEVPDDAVLHELVTVVKQHALHIVRHGLLTPETARELALFSSGPCQMHAIKIARSNPAVATKVDMFDRRPDPQLSEPYRLHCSNGHTIELHPSGARTIRPTVPADLNTKVACAYDPAAEAPLTKQWWRTYQPDVDVLRFQMEMAIRGLSGMGAQQFCAWYGPTAGNGKSTIEMLLTRVAGEYALKLPVEILLAKSRSARQEYRNELAQLRAARLVFADEPPEGSHYNTGVIKSLTGGATIDARENFKAPVSFVPQIVLTLVSNNRPTWGGDAGMDRRYVEIEWAYQVPAAARVEAFMKNVAAEASGVLNQLIRHWPGETPLTIPDAIQQQTEQAKRAADPVARFVDEAVEGYEDGPGRTRATDVYAGYVEWARQNGERPYSSTRLGTALARMGYVKVHSNGTWYDGIRVTEEYRPSVRF